MYTQNKGKVSYNRSSYRRPALSLGFGGLGVVGGQCGCMLAVLLFNLILGGWSISYLIEAFLQKTIPFWGAVLIGLFAAEVSVPVAIVVWLLKFFHVM